MRNPLIEGAQRAEPLLLNRGIEKGWFLPFSVASILVVEQLGVSTTILGKVKNKKAKDKCLWLFYLKMEVVRTNKLKVLRFLRVICHGSHLLS
jgi:hypothetical protein